MQKYIYGLVLSIAFVANAYGCNLMAVGDQITRGDGSINGYREPLQIRLDAAGLSCNFVGDQSDGQDSDPTDGVTFDPHWQGSTNLFADVLAESIGSKVAQYHPDIVLLNIGTYDVLVQVVRNGPGTSLQPPFLAALDVVNVVDIIHATSPSTQIVVMIPGRGNPRNTLLVDLGSNVLALMRMRTFASVLDWGAILVAPSDYVALELPNQLGAKKIADAIFSAVEPRVRALNTPPPVPVPTALWLFGSALCGLTMRRRHVMI